MPQLQVLNGPLQWKTFNVAGPRFVIGRRKGCHLILDDGWVSREHTVIIEPSPGVFLVQDLNSENGSYLNGRRINETRLEPQDVLRIGRTEMRFVVGIGERAEAPLSPRVAHAEEGERGGVAPPMEDGITLIPGASPKKEEEAAEATLSAGSSADTDSLPRRDLKEQVRRLESLLSKKEEEISHLATENAVLKKGLVSAGALDRVTGALDIARIAQDRGPGPRFRWPPGAQLRFPTAQGGGLEVGGPGTPESQAGELIWNVVGVGREGARALSPFLSLGYTSAQVWPWDSAEGGEKALLPHRQIDLITEGGGVQEEASIPSLLDALAALDEEERASCTGAVVPLGEELSWAHGLLEAGRLDFCLLIDPKLVGAGSLDTSAAALSLAVFDRAALGAGGEGNLAEGDLLRFLGEARACTLGLGASESLADAPQAVDVALGKGLHCDPGPLSRVRSALILLCVGRDIRGGGESEAPALAKMVLDACRQRMPQVRPRVMVLEDGAPGLRCFSLLGGIRWPGTSAAPKVERARAARREPRGDDGDMEGHDEGSGHGDDESSQGGVGRHGGGGSPGSPAGRTDSGGH